MAAVLDNPLYDHFVTCLNTLKDTPAVYEERSGRGASYNVLNVIFEFGMKGVTFTKAQSDEIGPLLFFCLPRLAEYAEEEMFAPALEFGCGREKHVCTMRSAVAFLVDPNSPYRVMRAWNLPLPPLLAMVIAAKAGRFNWSSGASVLADMPPGGILHLFIEWNFSKVDWARWDARFINFKPPNYDLEKYEKCSTPQSFHPTSHFWWRIINKALKYSWETNTQGMEEINGLDVVIW